MLVVDDEPDLRFMVRLILETAGYDVMLAINGAEAWQRCQERAPDLVITDVMMPVMDGLQLIARLRSSPATASIPILVVSGHVHLATMADASLSKPFLRKDLLAATTGLIGVSASR